MRLFVQALVFLLVWGLSVALVHTTEIQNSREKTFANQGYKGIAADASAQVHIMEAPAKAEQNKLWKDEGDEYDQCSESDDSSWSHDDDCEGDDDHSDKKKHYGHKSKHASDDRDSMTESTVYSIISTSMYTDIGLPHTDYLSSYSSSSASPPPSSSSSSSSSSYSVTSASNGSSSLSSSSFSSISTTSSSSSIPSSTSSSPASSSSSTSASSNESSSSPSSSSTISTQFSSSLTSQQPSTTSQSTATTTNNIDSPGPTFACTNDITGFQACDKEGEEPGWYWCVLENWVHQTCEPGTVCRQGDDGGVFCDFLS